MWNFVNAGRAVDVIAALTLLDPLLLPNNLARSLRTQALATLGTLPPNTGILAFLQSNPASGIFMSLQRQAFGSYGD